MTAASSDALKQERMANQLIMAKNTIEIQNLEVKEMKKTVKNLRTKLWKMNQKVKKLENLNRSANSKNKFNIKSKCLDLLKQIIDVETFEFF